MPDLSATPLRYALPSGLTLAADGWGNPTHRPVLLLHGGGQTRYSWGDTAQLIAQQGYYAVALDARGHGQSDWSAQGHYRADHLVEDLRGVMQDFDQPPALVGASLGGLTALLAAGEPAPPGEVAAPPAAAVVLVDIAPKTEQKGIERIFAFMSANQRGFATLDEVADAVAAYLPHRPRPTDHTRLEKNLRRQPDGRYYWHWDPRILRAWQALTPDDQLRHTERLYAAAKNLRVPTLIVRGGMSDVVSPHVVSEFLANVPHVRSVEVATAGHMVAGDSNHAFSHAVIDFLREVFPANEGA